MPDADITLVSRLLAVIEDDIVPLTRNGVARGDKIFGSAILLKSDLSLVIAGTNAETENPLWHGEVHTLKKFYEIPASDRPATSDCIFLATHEPCSLCLSAITWTGFDNFYYLFSYEDTKDAFNIPHDLKILTEVFGIKNGNYQRANAFWESHGIINMVANIPLPERSKLTDTMQELQKIYGALSETYQASKDNVDIPLN